MTYPTGVPKQYRLDLLVLQPTPFCNINCDYCYLSDRISKRQLSLDLLEHIFVKLFASKLTGPQLSVVWHAGEPLVLPIAYYEAALKKIKSLNTRGCQIHHAIQTNGTLITQRWCDFFKASNIHVGVSVDGPAFIHDANRKTRSGRGTHAKIMEGISLLQENGINFHVIAVISQQSLNFPDEIFKFFIQHGIRRVGFNIEEIEGENTVTSLKYPGTDKRYVRFMSRIYELSKITQGYLSIREFDDVKRLILSGLHIRRSFQSTPCSIISIDCNGNFTTFSPEFLGLRSDVYGDFILGNVRHDTFDAIFTSKMFQLLNQDIEAGIAACKASCDYFDLCGGGAPVNKYCENGTLHSSETMYCRYTLQIPVNLVLQDLEQYMTGGPESNVPHQGNGVHGHAPRYQ